MIGRLLSLLRAADRSRVALFVVSSVLACGVGFVFVSTPAAKTAIIHGGYYYTLGLFAALTIFGRRVLKSRRAGLPAIEPRVRRGVVLALALGTAFAVWADPFHHKILFDEYVLQGTAWHMHATKEVSTPVRAYDFSGTWLAIDAFLDKRPLFFPFLVSLIHDLTGFRVANAFALNVALAPVCLGLLYWLARVLTANKPALLAVASFATLPLFAQNVTGAGMELHNLVMIAATLTAAVWYLQAPDHDRLSLLVVSTVLLAQSRYESVLFVFPSAVVIVLGWLRAGAVLLPWAAVAAPLLLVPYAWHSRIVSASPALWQLREGESSRFSLQYLAGNLEGAWKFFFSFTSTMANSVWLSLAGFAGLGVALLTLWRWARRPASNVTYRGRAEVVAAVAFGAAVAANLGILMFYYWSRLDEPIASRFALPFYFVLALCAAWLAHTVDLHWGHGTRWAAAGLAAWMLVWGTLTYARRTYTETNLVLQEVQWELEEVTRRRGPLLLITHKATMPFLLERIPALNIPIGATRGPQIAWHMGQGTFREVLVSQVLRPTTADGKLGVDPHDLLPETFELEPVSQKRFGGRWIRISRVARIDVPADSKTADHVPAAPPDAR